MSNCELMASPKKMKSILDSQMNRMLKDKNFSASQVPYILEIGQREGTSMKDLCLALGADKGLTTRVVRTLIENGYIENRSETHRTYCLYLTDKGKEAFKLSFDTLNETMSRVIECLDPEEIEQLRMISAKINKRLDELYKY